MEPWLARAPMPPGFQICEDVPAQFQFSNKPDGFSSYITHFEKMCHYWNQLLSEALALDPFLNARLKHRLGEIRVTTQVSPFAYPDIRFAICSHSSGASVRIDKCTHR